MNEKTIDLVNELRSHCQCEIVEGYPPEHQRCLECRAAEEIQRLAPFHQAIDDEAVLTWTLSSKLSAKEQLGEIIKWHMTVATDPSVNGGYELVKVK